MTGNMISGEAANTRIAALYDTEADAAQAVDLVCTSARLSAGQVKLIHPHEAHFGRKLEPDEAGIARTAVRSHLTLGACGMILGLLVMAVLYLQDVAWVTQNPVPAGLVGAFIGAMLGMMGSGLITARPDHQAVITPVREAVRGGRWAVLVNPESPQQCDDAMRTLRGTHAEVMRTV
ncbi:riboflavin biosynthesis protein RibA [Cupriavidus sp. SZY C1]|uniref:riboflavin biosynthesis protein RibA n=1 Tax=Cupriavidus sp. SZY C1 TaxID=3055037 RepID=UPI0028B791B1|nr:riboflavin biosynthesis protein RibA [Cupriavidus sp. SZY C1]MDT6964663.1 riboflavin biosynthesis protein RibA [Cupriavidus sp. SZY C1]